MDLLSFFSPRGCSTRICCILPSPTEHTDTPGRCKGYLKGKFCPYSQRTQRLTALAGALSQFLSFSQAPHSSCRAGGQDTPGWPKSKDGLGPGLGAEGAESVLPTQVPHSPSVRSVACGTRSCMAPQQSSRSSPR